jgi:hypothetical protein
MTGPSNAALGVAKHPLDRLLNTMQVVKGLAQLSYSDFCAQESVPARRGLTECCAAAERTLSQRGGGPQILRWRCCPQADPGFSAKALVAGVSAVMANVRTPETERHSVETEI